MMRRSIVALAVLVSLPAIAQNAPDIFARRTFTISRIEKPISVDGVIRAEEWPNVTPIELSWETFPGNNIPAPVKTEALLAYDEQNIYIGFRAFDPKPSEIRANLTDRDTAFQDDFIGVVLDTFNDERRAFEFFVNPLGVQMDLANNDVGGGEDSTWDAIWDSAGRIHDDRYEVEIAIPWGALRFRADSGDQTWGLDMVRIYPRSARHRIGLHPQDQNRNCYICQESKLTGLTGLTPGRNIEIDPTVTSHRTDVRQTRGSIDIEAGLTGRWGVTPNLTLNAAINPDFSQVEADSAQLDVNTTFALFFNEKRPFFLEGADFFETPFNAIYTRTIASPDWGGKLTGKQGKSGGGVFAARDSVTNLLIPGSQGSSVTRVSQENVAGVARYRHDIWKSSTVGALITNRSGNDYSNRVAGFDGFFRVKAKDSISAQLLASSTRYPDEIVRDFDQPSGSFSDRAFRARYVHDSKNWFWQGTYEDVGEDFRADSGFMPRVNYTFANAGLQRMWWGKKENWWQRWWIGGDWDRTAEQNGQELEEEYETWFGFSGPKQSYVEFDIGMRDRFFNGVSFDGEQFINIYSEITPHKRLYASIQLNAGDTIDFANTRPATRLRLAPFVRYRVTRNLQLSTAYTREHLNVDGGRLFVAQLIEARGVYQFNLRTFVRLLVQYTDVERNTELYNQQIDARTKSLFPQLLFSYKINSQTVLFVGYSSTRLADGANVDLLENDRTFFVKIGYAWIF